MALEIKGLKANMLQVQKSISNLNAKSAKFAQIGQKTESGLDDIIKQVEGHFDDLNFAATVLGNSTEQSGDETKKEATGTTVPSNSFPQSS